MNQYFTNNTSLKSKLKVLNYSYNEYNISLKSDLGVFSKDKIDLGSQTLLESYFINGRKNVKVLDVGCGYGLLGISLAKIMNCDVDMIDVNKRAIHLCKMNIKENKVNAKVWESDVYENIKDKYDVIITNPPIKAGKKIYEKIINESFNYLKENGELWFVMRNNHGVKTIHKNLKKTKNSEIMIKNKGFYVIRAKCA
ncbi:MAG TPA: class I SAM-dependent methyltransferase [Mollicutes bacterium]|nr:class I SAM-dependent methyltransferase [Mollicutes bacterium]